MKKRGIMLSLIVFAFLLILSTNIVSAQYGLDDALNFIGGENILLIVTFGVSFAILLWVLGKFFKENKGVPLIISILLSLGITQAVNMMNFGLGISAGGLGLSNDLFGILIGILVLGIFVFMLWKAKMHTIWIMGLLIAFIGVIGGVEINYIAIALGIVLIILYALFFRKKEPGESRMPSKGVIFTLLALGVVGAIVWLIYSIGIQEGSGIGAVANPVITTLIAIALFLLLLFTYAYTKKKKYEKLPKMKLILYSILGSLVVAGIVWILYPGGIEARPGFDWFATNPLALLVLGIAAFSLIALVLFKTGKKENYWKKLVVLVVLTLAGIFIWLFFSGNPLADSLMFNPIFWVGIIVGITLLVIILSKTLRKKTAKGYDFEKEKKLWKGRIIFLLAGLISILLGIWKIGVPYSFGIGAILILLWFWAKIRSTDKYKGIQEREKKQLRSPKWITFTLGLITIALSRFNIGVPYTLFAGIGLLVLWVFILIFSKKKAQEHYKGHKKGYNLTILGILLGLGIIAWGFWVGNLLIGLIVGGLFIFLAVLLYLRKKEKEKEAEMSKSDLMLKRDIDFLSILLFLVVVLLVALAFWIGPFNLFLIAAGIVFLIFLIRFFIKKRKGKKGKEKKSSFSEAMKKRALKPATKKEEKLEKHLKEIEKSREKEEIEKKKMESKRLKTNWEESKKIFESIISKKDNVKIQTMYNALLTKYSKEKFPGLERQVSEIRGEIKKIYKDAMKELEEQRQNDSQAASLVEEATEETNSGLRRINRAQSAKDKLSKSEKVLRKINKKIRDLKKFMNSVELSDETAERLDQRLQFLEQTHFRILKLREDLRERLKEE